MPYSCSAWIHSIHRGIDVARAAGLTHIAGATGSTSEAAVQKLHGLPEIALIDMGDFVGGMLKYLRTHPVPRVTIAGGVAKMTKLAQGLLDLHSRRGAVDLGVLAELAAEAGGSPELARASLAANTAAEALRPRRARKACALGDAVARAGWQTAAAVAGRRADRDRDRGLRPRRPAGRPCAVRAGSRRASPETAAIVGVVERAVAEILRRQRAADQDQRRALDRLGGDLGRRCRPSVPRMIRSSGQLARQTTATGQSAP